MILFAGFSIVKLAIDRATGQQYACKMMILLDSERHAAAADDDDMYTDRSVSVCRGTFWYPTWYIHFSCVSAATDI